MPSIESQQEYKGHSPTDCYNAAEKSIESLGFSFVKKRPLGWLLQIKNEALTANISFRPGMNTVCILSLTSNTLTEEELQNTADRINETIQNNL